MLLLPRQVQERLTAIGTALKHLAGHTGGKAAPKLSKALDALRKSKVGGPAWQGRKGYPQGGVGACPGTAFHSKRGGGGQRVAC